MRPTPAGPDTASFRESGKTLKPEPPSNLPSPTMPPGGSGRFIDRVPGIVSRESGQSLLFLLGLTVARGWAQIALFQQGFISVSADEFARGIRAARWALEPSIDLLADVQGVWLPLEKYLNGLLLMVWPDTIWAPRLTVFVASCAVIFVLFFLFRYLFDSLTVAMLAAMLAAVQPWFAWLSGTPMLEMYYLAFFFGGSLFLTIWINEQRKHFWLWAGICFLLGTGFHVQSWTYINLINLLTLPYLFQLVRKKEFAHLLQLIAFYLVGNGLIIAFAVIEYANSGQMFAFLANHTSYSRWFYRGYDVPTVDKLLYYPRLVVRNTSWATWVCLVIALDFLRLDRNRAWKLLPLTFTLLALALNSAMNIFSGPPSAAEGRYSLVHSMMLSPYIAYGISRLIGWGRQRANRTATIVTILASIALFLASLWFGIARIPHFPQGMAADSVKTGRALHQFLETGSGRYMVELHYWDFLGVQLTAGYYDLVVYDRPYDIRNRDQPSLFEAEDEICPLLQLQQVRYVVLQDQGLKARVEQVSCLAPKSEVGRWKIYEWSSLHQGAEPPLDRCTVASFPESGRLGP